MGDSGIWPKGIPAADRMWATQLRVRHEDVIARYVARRLPDPLATDSVVRAVFADAAVNRDDIRGWPLPWLIANARSRCASAQIENQRQLRLAKGSQGMLRSA